MEPFIKEFSKNSEIGLIQLNIQENKFKMPVLWAMKPFIKRKTPKELRVSFTF
jgi:hypothetical protein